MVSLFNKLKKKYTAEVNIEYDVIVVIDSMVIAFVLDGSIKI